MASKRARKDLFWSVADFFRAHLEEQWAPTHAAYELVRIVAGGGYDWLVRMRIHVAPASTRPGSGHLFKASVTWWPTEARPATEAAIISKRTGWFAEVRRGMLRAGYRGGWESSPRGTYADFFKDVRTLAQVRREASLLEAIDVAAAGRTTKRASKRYRSAEHPTTARS